MRIRSGVSRWAVGPWLTASVLAVMMCASPIAQASGSHYKLWLQVGAGGPDSVSAEDLSCFPPEQFCPAATYMTISRAGRVISRSGVHIPGGLRAGDVIQFYARFFQSTYVPGPFGPVHPSGPFMLVAQATYTGLPKLDHEPVRCGAHTLAGPAGPFTSVTAGVQEELSGSGQTAIVSAGRWSMSRPRGYGASQKEPGTYVLLDPLEGTYTTTGPQGDTVDVKVDRDVTCVTPWRPTSHKRTINANACPPHGGFDTRRCSTDVLPAVISGTTPSYGAQEVTVLVPRRDRRIKVTLTYLGSPSTRPANYKAVYLSLDSVGGCDGCTPPGWSKSVTEVALAEGAWPAHPTSKKLTLPSGPTGTAYTLDFWGCDAPKPATVHRPVYPQCNAGEDSWHPPHPVRYRLTIQRAR